MGRTPMSGGSAFRFLPSEVADMEKALDASSGATPARSIVEGLAEKFTNSSDRSGREVQWKQVWNWFQNRRHAQKAKIEKLRALGLGVETPPPPPPPPRPVPVAGSSAVKKTIDVHMDFEAKSARDGAWYDVSAFISQRKSESGEPEVKVRFSGFGSEEDEWVNIATAVRQRSLPCETTECVAVLPGDLILCFQEGSEQALYFDADILDVQRRRHDVRGCRCRFWVRYRHDQTEEVVPLRKVCRRPETEQRLQLAREASKLSNKDIAMDRSLNGTPNLNAPPTTPVTPATITHLGTAFNATPLPGTSPNLYTPIQQGTITPGLQPMQPIPMQSLATPNAMASMHQLASRATSTFQGAIPAHAISPSQPSTMSMPIAAAQSPIVQQLMSSAPAEQSLERSISRQLTISDPVERRSRAGVEPSVTGEAQLHLFPVSENAGRHATTTASTGVVETRDLAQSMEIESATPAVDLNGPASAAAQAPEVGLPSGSNVPSAPMEVEKSLSREALPVDESNRIGETAVPAPLNLFPN